MSVILTIPAQALFAVILGTIPGLIMGLCIGALLSVMTRNVAPPYRHDDLMAKRFQIYPTVFVVTLVLSFILIYILWSWIAYEMRYAEDFVLWFIIAFPPFIAAPASTYAAHRYIRRLFEWSQHQDVRKSKAKNDEFYRLMDKQKRDDDFIEDDETSAQEEYNI